MAAQLDPLPSLQTNVIPLPPAAQLDLCSAGVKFVDVDADEGGEGQPTWRNTPAGGDQQPVDPGVIKAAVLGSAERPEEDLGGVVQALQDGVGVEVEGLAAAVGGNALGEVDAQPPAG